MGFEPTTPTLARLCSTPELRPRSDPRLLSPSALARKGALRRECASKACNPARCAGGSW